MILPKNTSIKILDHLLNKLSLLDLFPVIGAEIEFYLIKDDNSDFDNSWQAPTLNIDVMLEKEKGHNQFEVKIEHSSDIKSQIEKIIHLKKMIEKSAIKQGVIVNFRAKPMAGQPGSALHIHLHLENKHKENLFIKIADQESKLLLNSIAGLCSTMNENIIFFAPYEQAYLRFKEEHITTPSKVCWGGNNRSAAIRIPLDQKYNRRLEHRIACADSEPIEVVNAILFGILKGIEENQNPPEKIHGNAFLKQYDYPRLTLDIKKAKEDFAKSSFASLLQNSLLL